VTDDPKQPIYGGFICVPNEDGMHMTPIVMPEHVYCKPMGYILVDWEGQSALVELQYRTDGYYCYSIIPPSTPDDAATIHRTVAGNGKYQSPLDAATQGREHAIQLLGKLKHP